MVPLPLSSKTWDKVEFPNLLAAKSPEREREMDHLCQMIRNCARVGIPAAKYNMSLLGVIRTPKTPGRGASQYSTFKWAELEPKPPFEGLGPVSADLYWERITWFLERIVPVAAEYKIRIACHPHDPGLPQGKTWRGVETVLGSVDGLKRFLSIKENPYHGLNFCQGTVSEMLEKPAEQIHDVIRYFGSRKKIFNVHFRNIQGRFLDFRETFPDNGDVDMPRALRTYKEVGYDGMIMPDHVPDVPGDADHTRAFAYAFGYIRALLQTV
jgi:mannonate dehydratase